MSAKTAPLANQPFTYILTASADYLSAAIEELRQLDPRLHQIMEPDSEIAVVESLLDIQKMNNALQERPPIFVRHIFPAQSRVILTGDGNDLGDLARETLLLPAVAALTPEDTFSVQARVVTVPGQERPYSPYAIKSAIAPLVGLETGATEDVRSPELVISILALPTVGFVGISPVEFNLSDWAGGARRFAREEGQLSRSEFKLLEAIEVFGALLPPGGTALDLGAAPGGWSRVLRKAGLNVTAIDPGEVDQGLMEDEGIFYIRGHAQEWLQSAQASGQKFDVIVNDMRMDARDASRFMVEVAPLMRLNSFAIVTLKLPTQEAPGMDPIAILNRALAELRSRYRTVRARQLFHNRNEVTVYLEL